MSIYNSDANGREGPVTITGVEISATGNFGFVSRMVGLVLRLPAGVTVKKGDILVAKRESGLKTRENGKAT